jgi:Ni/Co efflux regulator RcnB
MKRLRNAVALSVLAAMTMTSGLAFADNYVRHNDWRHGGHIAHNDWNRGQRVDYRHYHLRQPPHGYEWRQVDGNFVLAAAATGLIASVVAASTVH